MKLNNLINEQEEKNLVEFGFKEIHHGDIDIEKLLITSLKGAPKEVGGNFWGSDNNLTSLEGAPEKIGGNFDCSYNKLTSLEDTPKEINGAFWCGYNKLTSLKEAPEKVGKVGGHFGCSGNLLISLVGAPKEVSGDFYCDKNQLISLEGAPEKVGGNFICSYNKLTSLHSVHKIIKQINGKVSFVDNPIKSHVLGLLLIEGITEIKFDNQQVQDILNKYLSSKDIFECQQELVDAGFEEYAQL